MDLNIGTKREENEKQNSRPLYDKANLKRAASSTLIGTVLEQYDMVLFGSASALIFNKLFFPQVSPAVGLLAAFGAYGVGFLARPLGGIFFSHFGEKFGRKWILVATLFLMGTATFAIALLPTFAMIGVAAPVLLVLLRLLQGFGAGAEQTGGMTLLAETAPPGKRGMFASLVAVGSGLGIIAGGGAWALAQALIPSEVFLDWGWRVVFASSLFVTLAAFIIRRKLRESPVFLEAKERQTVEKAPVIEVWRSGKRPLFTVFGMAFGTMANGYVFLAFMAGYLVTYIKVEASFAAGLVVAGAVATSISAFVLGTLTDRYGRRRTNLVLAVMLMIYPPIAFSLVGTGNTTLIFIAVTLGFALAVTGMIGAQAAYFPELFGSGFRVTGVTLGRELAAVLGGGFSPLICSALIIWSGGSWWPIVVYMMAAAAVTLVTTFLAPETLNRDLVTDIDGFKEREVTTSPVSIR
jgi:MFS family permease